MIRWRAKAIGGMLALVCGASGYGDWPEFRGPTGQGIVESSAELPLEWSDTTNVTWTVPVPGLGWSSPSVSEGRIYLTTAIEQGPNTYSLEAVCFDAASGARIWQKQVFLQEGRVQIHRKNSHASPTPLVDGERVYVHFGPHGTACLSAESGEVEWSRRVEYRPTHGNGGSPAVFENLLILCIDGQDDQYVIAFDKFSGEPRWKTDRNTESKKGFSFSTPLVIQAGGRWQAVCPGSHAVVAYDPATGQEIWRVRYGDGYSVVPRPVYANGLVYVCTGYEQASLIAVDPTGQGDLTDSHVRWRVERAVPHNPTPIAVGEWLFLVSDRGIASCLSCQTGEVQWQERLGGNFSASPIATADRVYLQDEKGTAYVVAASPEFRMLATNSWSEDRTYASFAVDGNALILRSEDKLCRVD